VAAVVVWSAAVSIKMSALLLAPAWLWLLAVNCGWASGTTLRAVAGAVAVQVAAAAPFITTRQDAAAYAGRAFEFGRAFMYTWTVNWKMLPQWVFDDPRFWRALLAGHAVALVVLGAGVWCSFHGGVSRLLPAILRSPTSGVAATSPAGIAYALWTANFAGIVFARSLHYQFLSWYAWSVPALIGWAAAGVAARWGRGAHAAALAMGLLAAGAVEVGFNVGTAAGAGTAASSAGLQAGHAALLGLVLVGGLAGGLGVGTVSPPLAAVEAAAVAGKRKAA
jgi:hypothetical protein